MLSKEERWDSEGKISSNWCWRLPVFSLMLLVLVLEEMLTGVGYEVIPKPFEDKGVQGLAIPGVFFLAFLSRDCALSCEDKYDSYCSDSFRSALR